MTCSNLDCYWGVRTIVCVRLDCRTPPPHRLYHGRRPLFPYLKGPGAARGRDCVVQHNSRYVELGREALAAQDVWLILLHISPARVQAEVHVVQAWPDATQQSAAVLGVSRIVSPPVPARSPGDRAQYGRRADDYVSRRPPDCYRYPF